MSFRQKMLLGLACVALVALLVPVLYGDRGYMELLKQQRELSFILEKNSRIRHENHALYRTIDRLKNDPDYIEIIAREELGMVGKHDRVFKLKDPAKPAP